MGRDLKQKFGESYHSVGLTTLKGQYSFIEEKLINSDHDYGERLKQAELEPFKAPVWESSMASFGNAFYLDIPTFRTQLKTDDIIGLTRLIGYGQETKRDIYEVQLTKNFDSMIFIKTTTATKPLKD